MATSHVERNFKMFHERQNWVLDKNIEEKWTRKLNRETEIRLILDVYVNWHRLNEAYIGLT